MSCVSSDQLQKRGESIIGSPHFGRWITFFSLEARRACGAPKKREVELGSFLRAQRERQRAARRRASVGALRIDAGRKPYSSRMMIYGRLFLRPCSSWYPLASTNMNNWLYGIGCPLASFMSICARSLVLSSL